MRVLQQELEQLKEDREREQELSTRRAREDEEELQILRDRCERLEAGGGGISLPITGPFILIPYDLCTGECGDTGSIAIGHGRSHDGVDRSFSTE